MEHFTFNERLQLYLPNLQKDYYSLSDLERSNLKAQWEKIRSTIPDKIKQLDKIIVKKQNLLAKEANLEKAHEINEEIAVLASKVNDLWIWFRS